MKERQASFNDRLGVFYARCPECGAVIVFRPGENLAGACQHFAGRDGLILFFEYKKEITNDKTL